MVKVKSRPQTERVTKVIVVRKSVVRKGVPVQVRSGVQLKTYVEVARLVKAAVLYAVTVEILCGFKSHPPYKIKP